MVRKAVAVSEARAGLGNNKPSSVRTSASDIAAVLSPSEMGVGVWVLESLALIWQAATTRATCRHTKRGCGESSTDRDKRWTRSTSTAQNRHANVGDMQYVDKILKHDAKAHKFV